ncbi:YbaY family lipoprotein [Sphingomonas sp. LaA6.9]|uniref:YbaY family lipoprotein n=1 Tax=Sphingomonas sp. LaA6.9 TaxID=2919914 RepID=UPI001F4F9EA9|nr:YbaY family lipoprotein [Sphingomonas sp. LaA6.9]MCJ8157756.1 YbaY family lipoprotein [Sphingomonas sp. LaA6.9]
MDFRTITGALALTLAATACANDVAPEPLPAPGLVAGRLAGTVSYRERIALPADAVVKVQIADVARQDVPARTIAETRIETEGRQVPIAFELAYPADHPSAHAEYAVSARIEGGDGRLLFITDTRNPLPQNGRIDLWLVNAQR